MEGTAFGRYQLLQMLGRGGMGEVWRAHDTVTDRIVAVKVLPAQLGEDPVYQERFRREAFTASRLNSPHVVPIHTYGEIDGRLFVEMRLIEGRDLERVLAAGPLDVERAVRIIDQVAKALHAAHKAGLVHRDVKPSNILLDDEEFAYLIDFGIARGVGETRLTSTGAMIGTWQYVAPERFGSGEVDARADIYALTCVLYECLTGQPPFAGDTLERLVAAHLNAPPPRPSSARRNVPWQLDNVIAIGMAKNPDERYVTTVELARAARDALTAPMPRAVPTEYEAMRGGAASASTQHAAEYVSAAAVPPRLVSTSTSTRQRPVEGGLADQAEASGSSPPRWRRRRVLIPAGIGLLAVIAVAVTFVWISDDPPATQRGFQFPSIETADFPSVDAPNSALTSDPVVVAVRPNVVRINATADKCGRFEGSGFVVSPGRVMTAAHVVAGADSVEVETDGSHYKADVVSYDPNADIAILAVAQLSVPPLAFEDSMPPSGTDVIVLGYPDGGRFAATPARIREVIELNGPDIYRTETVTREVYTIRSAVQQANAGGPLINREGRVLGVVLGAPADDPNTGFVSTFNEVARQLEKVGNTQPVSTGACIQ